MVLRTKLSILFVSAFHTPFIQDDIDLLEKHFSVRKQIGHGTGAAFRIAGSSFRSDLVFCWFASVYAFVGVLMARILGHPSFIVVGGVDVAKDSELQYGIWLSPWRAILVRYALRHASHVLVVDPSLKEAAIRLAGYSGDNIRYLPTGFDAGAWKPAGEKEPLVLTVAAVRDPSRLRVKGIDVLVETARRLPGLTFVVIGVDEPLTGGLRPPLNVHFLPLMKRSELLPYYQRAKVYCQPSRREGLPNTLCEAMLCGCIPVVSNVGGNPTAAGDAGILVPPGDIDRLAEALGRAVTAKPDFGARARARIVAMFPKEKRETELLAMVDSLPE